MLASTTAGTSAPGWSFVQSWPSSARQSGRWDLTYTPPLAISLSETGDREMKITDVEAIYVRIPETQDGRAQDALLIKVHTDEGITGIGEVHSSPLAAQGAILGPYCSSIRSGLKHLVVGEDPFETEYLWDKMY